MVKIRFNEITVGDRFIFNNKVFVRVHNPAEMPTANAENVSNKDLWQFEDHDEVMILGG
jgi:hypothetical protein